MTALCCANCCIYIDNIVILIECFCLSCKAKHSEELDAKIMMMDYTVLHNTLHCYALPIKHHHFLLFPERENVR